MAHTRDEQLISIREAAEMISMSMETIRRHVARGLIRGYRVGPRRIMVSEADVRALRKPMTPPRAPQ